MQTLDLRGVPCPRNASLALIKLTSMELSEVLEILVDEGEPVENVSSSLVMDGHEIMSSIRIENDYWKLQVKVNT